MSSLDTLVTFKIDTATAAVKVFGSNGEEIPDGGATASTFVMVRADDGETGSGIKEIAFKHTGSGGVIGEPGCCSHIDDVRTFTDGNQVQPDTVP